MEVFVKKRRSRQPPVTPKNEEGSSIGYEGPKNSIPDFTGDSKCNSPEIVLTMGQLPMPTIDQSQCSPHSDVSAGNLSTCYSSSSLSLSDSSVTDSSIDEDHRDNLAALRGNRTTSARRQGRDESSLFLLDTFMMAQVLSFLDPSEILMVLTLPLCKEWRTAYGSQQDLWKTLCLMEPFQANIPSGDISDSDDSFCCIFECEPTIKDIFGEYRLMYTSFVRCFRYLSRIEEDIRKGTPTSVINCRYGRKGPPNFGMSQGLRDFLKKKAPLPANRKHITEAASSPPVDVTDYGYRKRRNKETESNSKKPKFGNSMITSRLLGPSAQGKPSHLNLSKSCAIFSIVNWMAAYPDVEGVQVKCLGTLPCLLEDETHRLTAQRVGLVEVLLQAMLRFPDSVKVHIAVFHALVLLARPLGGREGMLFDTTMARSSAFGLSLMGRPTLPSTTTASRSGAAFQLNKRSSSRFDGTCGLTIMFESMRRFQTDANLQAMSCWAMVNLALVPAQKTIILSLGGIQAAINAMVQHPHHFDVQFRALFALINLVVVQRNPPTLIQAQQAVSVDSAFSSFKQANQSPASIRAPTEKDAVDQSVHQIASLVVRTMKNFCSSEPILNRACLVLHNLSQREAYVDVLLFTPHCYQMLEWCIANYRNDPILRRSAVSTLHRLQLYLSERPSVRKDFAKSIRSQQLLRPSTSPIPAEQNNQTIEELQLPIVQTNNPREQEP